MTDARTLAAETSIEESVAPGYRFEGPALKLGVRITGPAERW